MPADYGYDGIGMRLASQMVRTSHRKTSGLAGGEVDYDVGDFFIVGKYQRKGIGAFVAEQIFDMFRGRWTVRQLVTNVQARPFWEKIVPEYTGGHFTQTIEDSDGYRMCFLKFSNA